MTVRFTRSLAAASAAFATAAAPFAAFAQDATESERGHPLPGEIGFQPSVTPIMDSIVVFHNTILLWACIVISVLVLALLAIVVFRFNAKSNPTPSSTTHNTLIEVVWTVAPILILVVIAIPSFAVLTDQETIPDGTRKYLGSNIFSFGEVEVPAPTLTVKATGSQWYWTYEYVDQQKSFDSSIMLEPARLAEKANQPRLLAVDNELVVPVNATVRVEVTASDVLHAFAVPSFGILVDAVPGRLNETWFNARKTGLYYGACRELCGKDHAFMPIAVRVVTQEQFDTFMTAFQAGTYADAAATLPDID